MERHLFEIEQAPRMLPRKTRLKVWGALLGVGTWFAFVFSLLAFRLKSDDLEPMEREVYEELKVKNQVKKFIEAGKSDK